MIAVKVKRAIQFCLISRYTFYMKQTSCCSFFLIELVMKLYEQRSCIFTSRVCCFFSVCQVTSARAVFIFNFMVTTQSLVGTENRTKNNGPTTASKQNSARSSAIFAGVEQFCSIR